jgi:hypothetical protein
VSAIGLLSVSSPLKQFPPNHKYHAYTNIYNDFLNLRKTLVTTEEKARCDELISAMEDQKPIDAFTSFTFEKNDRLFELRNRVIFQYRNYMKSDLSYAMQR